MTKARHLVFRHERAGWIIRIRDVNDTGTIGHFGQQCIDRHRKFGFRRFHRRCADPKCEQRIHNEGVFAEQDLVARARVGPRQQAQNFVGPGAANYTVGIKPVPRADRFAQFNRCAVRVAMQRAGEGLVCFDRLGARAERTFV